MKTKEFLKKMRVLKKRRVLKTMGGFDTTISKYLLVDSPLDKPVSNFLDLTTLS